MHNHHQVGRSLGDGDADVAYVCGQARQRCLHAILNLHLRDIEVGTEVERNGDRKASVTRGIRRDIEHALDAVDLLFERRNDRRSHHLGAGAGILPGDVDHRRRDLGILRNRQAAERDRTEYDENNRDDGRENRTVNEEVRDSHLTVRFLVGPDRLVLGAHGFARCRLGRDFGAGPNTHQAVHDDQVVGVEACFYDPQPINDGTERHVFRGGNIVAVHDINEFFDLLGTDRGIGD